MRKFHWDLKGFLLFPLMVVLIGCTETHQVFFVATDGDDLNTCTEPENPCRTVPGAYNKASSGDWIEVASGSYRLPKATENGFEVDIDISIVGAGKDLTILEGTPGTSGAMGTIIIRGGNRLYLSQLTVLAQHRYNSVLTVDPGGELETNDCIIGNSTGWGVRSGGNVIINACTIQENRLGIYNQSGGEVELHHTIVTISEQEAISNLGTISIHDSVIRNNGQSYEAYSSGGYAIWNRGDMYMERSQIEDNVGTGLLVREGRSELHGVSISGHRDNGIEVWEGADLFMNDSQVDSNYIGAKIHSGAYFSVNRGIFSTNVIGIENQGTVLLHTSALMQNGGMALNNLSGELTIDIASIISGNGVSETYSREYTIDNLEGELIIEDSRIENNHNEFGVLHNRGLGEVSLRNVLIIGEGHENTLENNGRMSIFNSILQGGNPAVHNIHDTSHAANLEISHTAIIDSAIGFRQYSGVASIQNSTISGTSDIGMAILDGNTKLSYSTVIPDGDDLLISSNATFDVQNSILVRDCSMDSARGISPETNLGCEGDYIGIGELTEINNTWVHPLLNDSPAIDAAEGECPSNDQRLAPRPTGGSCDIGAYEAMIPLMATSMICEGIQGVSIRDNGVMRTNVKVPDASGEYAATLNNSPITCLFYSDYPDTVLCDSPKPQGNTLATLIIFDDQGNVFCHETFTVPGPSGGQPDKGKDEGCNLSVDICSAQGQSFDTINCQCVDIQ